MAEGFVEAYAEIIGFFLFPRDRYDMFRSLIVAWRNRVKCKVRKMGFFSFLQLRSKISIRK